MTTLVTLLLLWQRTSESHGTDPGVLPFLVLVLNLTRSGRSTDGPPVRQNPKEFSKNKTLPRSDRVLSTPFLSRVNHLLLCFCIQFLMSEPETPGTSPRSPEKRI